MSAAEASCEAAGQGDGAKEGAILDRGYQRYTGRYTTEAARWAVIAARMLQA